MSSFLHSIYSVHTRAGSRRACTAAAQGSYLNAAEAPAGAAVHTKGVHLQFDGARIVFFGHINALQVTAKVPVMEMDSEQEPASGEKAHQVGARCKL